MNDDPKDQRIQGQPSEDVPAPPPDSGTPESRPDRLADAPPGGPDSRIQGGSIRLFRVAGIDVLLHWSWFFFAVLRLQPGGPDDSFGLGRYESQVWYAAEYLALFGMVLLHEFGHVLACRSVGGIANRIVLWPLGGIAFVAPPPRPGAFLWSIAAGPLVNVLLLAPTVGFWVACRAAGCQDTAPDLYRFAAGLAWINGYLLVFNVLPVYPLDGGKILQALLWFVLGRARSLLVATAVGLLTALGLLAVAVVERSLVWGVMAAFGVLFSLVGVQGARGLTRMLSAPRREEAACPGCGAAPPVGAFWPCPRCMRPFDAFAGGGSCPNCGTPLAAALCPTCGRSRPPAEWHPDAIPRQPSDGANTPVAIQVSPGPQQQAGAPPPPTVAQRVVWGVIFAALALACCGLPNVEKQPLGLIIWTAGGAVLGALSAGTMTRAWRSGQARKQLSGSWRLVEEDGQPVGDGGEPRRLILSGLSYEERVGDRRDVRGSCWTDPLAEPAAISLTPKAGTDAGQPRRGIYRLEGKSLTVCLAYPGRPRPTEFVSRPGVQQVRVYRRGGKASG